MQKRKNRKEKSTVISSKEAEEEITVLQSLTSSSERKGSKHNHNLYLIKRLTRETQLRRELTFPHFLRNARHK